MQILMSLVTALAMAGGLILAFNLLIIAPWQILLPLLIFVWFKIEAALEQCRQPVEGPDNDPTLILTYRGADYKQENKQENQVEIFDGKALPDLSYRGTHYKPSHLI